MEEALDLDRAALDRARLSRDPRFDGKFFIGVTSTGVYCRPICPSPTSNAANVRYYLSAAAAQEAGFRPCLRCRPEAAPGSPAWLGTSAVVRRALRLIEEGVLDEASVEALAKRLGIGARHLCRLFLQHVGASPVTVAQTRRLLFAKHLLHETSLPITQIALEAGFGSVRRFNDVFRRAYDRAPSDVRRQRRAAEAGPDGDEVALRLALREPYDWPALCRFLAARALPGVERVDEGDYRRTVALDSGHAVIRVRALEQEPGLELRVRGAAVGALFHVASTVRRCFDLTADPARIAAALHGDPLLGPLVRSRPGLRIPGAWEPFECALRALLERDAGAAGARDLGARLVAAVGRRIGDGPDGLTHLFPSPSEVAGGDLRGLGLAPASEQAVRELARGFTRLAPRSEADEILAALEALPAIGRSIAQVVALRALGEPDAFPAGDASLRRAAGREGHPLGEPEMEARAEGWRPWRGYAAVHLWEEDGTGPAGTADLAGGTHRRR